MADGLRLLTLDEVVRLHGMLLEHSGGDPGIMN